MTAILDAPVRRRPGRPPRAATALATRERLETVDLWWRLVASDPLNFLSECLTNDEHADDTLQPFPLCAPCARDERANDDVIVTGEQPDQRAVCRAHGVRHKPYLRPFVRTWQESEILLTEKSRQVVGSWTSVGLHLWRALTKPGALIGFQSGNHPKSRELLYRAYVMYASLPVELQRFGPMSDNPRAMARKIDDEIRITHVLPDGRKAPARILALPNGPNQVRMYTFTEIFMDECQNWESDEDFEDSYTAALATVKGGGRLLAISSVGHPSRFHYRLCAGQVR